MKNTRQNIYNTNIFTDKANSMLTRMQSLGSNFFCPQTVTTVYCIFVMFIKLTLSAKDWKLKLKILFCDGDRASFSQANCKIKHVIWITRTLVKNQFIWILLIVYNSFFLIDHFVFIWLVRRSTLKMAGIGVRLLASLSFLVASASLLVALEEPTDPCYQKEVNCFIPGTIK